jgi:hypothetical protein
MKALRVKYLRPTASTTRPHTRRLLRSEVEIQYIAI